MAVFSNLEGTMKRSFILGKNGVRLEAKSSALRVTNYQNTELLPITAGDPVDDTQLVTLSYLKATQGQGGNNLSGTAVPDASVGVNGDVYYQLDSTNILTIYFKDSGIWKPFVGGGSTQDSAYTTTYATSPSTYLPVTGGYQTSVLETTHGRGADIVVQLQGDPGDVMGASVQIDAFGNVRVTTTQVPVDPINIIFVGRTTMTQPFAKLINKNMWNTAGSKFTIFVPQSEHGQEAGSLFLNVLENTVDAANSAAPYALTTVDTNIASNGDVTITSDVVFSGKIIISGK